MTPGWGDLNARASGLGTHLLSRETLRSLARSPDVASLAQALAAGGYPAADVEGRVTPAAVELPVRRVAARRLHTLARWSGGRTRTLAVVFEEEDRRSLRAILRGAAQGVSWERRLAGLIPTPALPERALEELARQGTPAEIGALLAAWGNPYGTGILAEVSDPPDLFALELRIDRTFAERAARAARRGGGLLRGYVRFLVDLENTGAALLLAEQGHDTDPRTCFLPGGRRLAAEVFVRAAATRSARDAATILAGAFRNTPYADAVERHAESPAALTQALAEIQLEGLVRAGRLDPLGPAPLLVYVHRLRAEVRDLQRVIWGVTFGAPAALVAGDAVAAT